MSVIRQLAAGVVAALIGFTSISSIAAADADAPFVGGLLALTSDPAVVKELGLSDEVKKQLADLIAKRVDEGTPLGLDIKDLTPEEQKAKLAPFVAESEKQGLALLTDEQKAKLQQIHVRKLGMKGLLEDSIAEQLGLPENLRKKISNAYAFAEMQAAGKPEADRKAAAIKVEKDVLGMLDKDQRAKWEALAGQGIAVAQAEDGGEKPMSDKPETDKPANERTTSRSTRTIVNSKAGSDTTLKEPKAPLKAGDPNVKLKFQFQHAPWKEVIEWFAEQAGLSLVTDVYPQGTFNFVEPSRTYTPAQSIDLLNSVLILKGYRLVRKETMLFLLSSEDELPSEFYRRVTEEDLDKMGEFEIVQCQFQLSKITAEEAEVEVRKLISTQGKVVTLPKAKQIVVTEMVGALKLVRNALKKIENPDPVKDENVTVVKLDYLRPSEFMLLARQLLGIPDNVNATPDGSLRIAMDELGMRLLVTGKAEKVDKLLDIQKLIDVSSGTGDEGPVAEQPQLIIYTVDQADPMSVLQILQTLLAGKQDVRLTLDPKSGNLVAYCYPSNHKTIKAVLDDMQKDATQYKTFKLRKNDPQAITLQINELFGGGEKGAANAPKVVADTTNLQLLVRASPAQLTKIQDLLKEMGELGGTATAESAVRSNMRVLPASGRTLENVLSQLEYSWPAAGNANKIKVHRLQRNVPDRLRDNLSPPGARGQDAVPGESPEERRFREEFGVPKGNVNPAKPAPAPAPADAPKAKGPGLDGVTIDDGPNVDPNRVKTGPERQNSPAKAPGVPVPEESKPNTSKSYRFQFISQPAPEEAKEETKTPEEPAAPAGPKSVPGADIVVTIGPGSIIIASEDLDALDKFEAELRVMLEMAGGTNTKEMHYVQLRHAKAQVAATLLTEILNGAPASNEGGGGGGSLMGDLASSMMGDMLGGLLGGLGGGGSSGGTTSSSGVSIIPDIRLNALYVNCTQRDMDRIDDLLTYIDVPFPEEGIQINPAPRFIPIVNTTAESVAVVVRSVYAGRLTAEAGGQQRQPNPAELIQALRGGGRGGQQQQNKGEEQKMTVGVDNRTNSLVVVAPDYLFEEVKALVKTLDVAELASDTVVRVHSLRSANADVLSRSLGSLYGDSLTITKTSTTGTTSRPGGAGGGTPPGGGQQRQGGNQPRQGQSRINQAPQQPQIPNEVRQQMELFNALQGGRGGRGGGNFGGRGGR